MERKFGRDGRLKSVHDRLTRLGDEVGIGFAFDRIERAPNTLDAHRLIRWAGSADAQREVVDRLFRAYFVEGRDVGDRAVLLDVAAACGLDADIVDKRFWATARMSDAVRREIAEAQAIGVTGVPFFIFAGRVGVPGAQDVALLRRAMDAGARGAERRAGDEPLARSSRGVERLDQVLQEFDARRCLRRRIRRLRQTGPRGREAFRSAARTASSKSVRRWPAQSRALTAEEAWRQPRGRHRAPQTAPPLQRTATEATGSGARAGSRSASHAAIVTLTSHGFKSTARARAVDVDGADR